MTSDATKTNVKRGTDCIGVSMSFVCHDGQGKVLLHKRSENCRDEKGRWDNGGGALEFGEEFAVGLHRELMEEYCAAPLETTLLGVYNNLREHDGMQTHWVNVIYAIRVDPAQVKIGEPEKMDEMGWFTPDALPEPQHTTLQKMVQMARDAGIV